MSSPPAPSDGSDLGGRFGQAMMLGAWVLLLILVTLLFSSLLERRSNPNHALSVSPDADRQSDLKLLRNPEGHYLAPGEINGLAVIFLVDTGATRVAVPKELAERAGLSSRVRSQTQTASGVAESWLTRIDLLRLGPFEMREVPAVIIPEMPGDEVLLGMSFLKHLKLEQQDGVLRLSLPE